ncbi:hypothetical protein ANN_19649 [Periplaneta americana]|uniref:Uncharacterized protein n=1 Tax=Periplaneta americana TaxID=6978 RepID=A0ABQ8SB45_PERAM|nr:hypothetical protein ANN_19649 [Periplaneta americana]
MAGLRESSNEPADSLKAINTDTEDMIISCHKAEAPYFSALKLNTDKQNVNLMTRFIIECKLAYDVKAACPYL